MTRRYTCLVIFCLSILVGCSRQNNASVESARADSAQAVPGDWAVVRFESEPDTLNPITYKTAVAGYAISGINNSQIYEYLMGYNTKDWHLTEPLLAEAPPEVSDDHLSYTFTIRDGIKWHDGQPLTLDDVLFTFKATMCPLVDAARFRSSFTDLTDVQIDGRKVRFLMKQPSVFNVANLAGVVAIVPKHVFDPQGLLDGFTFKDIIAKGKTDPKIKKFSEEFNAHAANRAPVGTGPFKFEKWDTGKEIVLARNDQYWGKKPYLDKIVFRVITDFAAALTALKAGEIDVQPRLLPVQYAQQTSGPSFDEQLAKTAYSIPAYGFITWNNERPFFKDKRVRQALTMLIDRQKVIEVLRFGMGKIANGPVNPQSADFDPSLKSLPYDPKKAEELLDEAGWKDHDGDGIRDKDGVKFSFEFLGGTGSTMFPQFSPILRESLRQAGIEVNEKIIDFNVMISTLRDHKYDASILILTADLNPDLYEVWHSSSASGGMNFANFKNGESDRLLEQMRLEFDADKRKQLSWHFQELINDEQPYTFLFYVEDPAAYSKRFQNVKWLPLRPGYDLNSWWVPKELRKHGSTTTP